MQEQILFWKYVCCFINVSMSDLYIPTIGLPILMLENMWTNSSENI